MKNGLRIFPIMVIYKSQLGRSEVYRTLLKGANFESFMVYDNSPASYNFNQSELPDNAVYIRDIDNGGVSRAYNVGAQYASEQGFTHVLLLDQDTSFPPEAFEVYKKYANTQHICAPILQMKNGAPFSPCVRRGLRTRAVSLSDGNYSLQEYSPVNSGMCIPLATFFSAGRYNEKVKLDFADFEFISRCRKVCETLTILPIKAIQDFSNDEKNLDKLFARYVLYLESASATRWETLQEKIMFHIEVLKHTVALTRRTETFLFLRQYIRMLFNK